MSYVKYFAVAALSAFAVQSHAVTFTVGGSMAPLATVETFDAAPIFSVTGGLITSGDTLNVRKAPLGGSGNYLASGDSSQPSPAILSLGFSANYLGFNWGSPDRYNTVEFYDAGMLVASFTGQQIFGGAANGFNGNSSFVSFAGAGDLFDEVHFVSSANAFEVDNVGAIAAPVPEPETYALMLGGLGLVGWMARRRRPV